VVFSLVAFRPQDDHILQADLVLASSWKHGNVPGDDFSWLTHFCSVLAGNRSATACSGLAGAHLSLTQAELPPLPAHVLAGDADGPRRLSKPFVPPRRAKGGGLSGPRVQASPAENVGDAPRRDVEDSGDADGTAQHVGNSGPAVVPDTQDAEQEAERAPRPSAAAAADKPQRACSADAAGLAAARRALPPVTACTSASANPR